ncbi:hypothetical protein ACFX2G_004340 [Malus domestica]
MVEINKLAFPEDEEGSRVFRQLKAYCFELLASPKPQEALLCSLVSAPFSSPVSASCSPAILRCLEELLKKCCFGSVDQSKIASASVGHWLSLLFKAADNEAARGHLGNVKLRIEAFTMLRVLVGMAVGRCLCLVSNVVQICGGGFFSQLFRTDGSHFWKLLSTSPFHRKPKLKEERIPLQLPYRIRVHG